MAGTVDLYKLFSVSRDADTETISRAYRQLARRFHPDLYNGSDATAKMQQLNQAYEVLRDPSQRQAYDATLPRPQPKPTPQPRPAASSQQAANDSHGFARKAAYDEAWRQQQERYAWYRQHEEPRETDWRVNPVDYRFKKGGYQGEYMFAVFRKNHEYVWRVVREGTGDPNDQAAAKAFLRSLPEEDTMRIAIEPPNKSPFVVGAIVVEIIVGVFNTSFISHFGGYAIAIAAMLGYAAVRTGREFSVRQERRRLLQQE